MSDDVPTIWLLMWKYQDHSACGVVSAHESEDNAVKVQAFLEKWCDGARMFSVISVPIEPLFEEH